MDYFNIKSFDEIDLLISEIIREPVWHRSGPSYNANDIDFSYRFSSFTTDEFILLARFELETEKPEIIKCKITKTKKNK